MPDAPEMTAEEARFFLKGFMHGYHASVSQQIQNYSQLEETVKSTAMPENGQVPDPEEIEAEEEVPEEDTEYDPEVIETLRRMVEE